MKAETYMQGFSGEDWEWVQNRGVMYLALKCHKSLVAVLVSNLYTGKFVAVLASVHLFVVVLTLWVDCKLVQQAVAVFLLQMNAYDQERVTF